MPRDKYPVTLYPVPPLIYRPHPNLKPGTVCVCGINGLRTGMHTT